MPEPLIAPLVGESPLRALLRHRLSTRTDVALVFVTPGGTYRTALPRPHRGGVAEHKVRLGGVLVRDFAQVYRVRLAEQALSFSVRLPCAEERASVVADVQLVARVHDPALVVEQRIIDPEPYVRTGIQAQMREVTAGHDVDTLPDAEQQIRDVLARAEPFRMPELGMSYGPGHVRFRLESGPLGSASGTATGMDVPHRPAAPVTPAGFDGTGELGAPFASDPTPWFQLRRQELDFYKDLVEEGPSALIAFWLSQNPDSIREIVQWIARSEAPYERAEGSRASGDEAFPSAPSAEGPDPPPLGEEPQARGIEGEADARGIEGEAGDPEQIELQRAMRAILSRGGYTAQQLRHLAGQLGGNGDPHEGPPRSGSPEPGDPDAE